MKLAILILFTFLLSLESYAQSRAPRGGRGPIDYRSGPSGREARPVPARPVSSRPSPYDHDRRPDYRPDSRPDYRPDYRVEPRYTPRYDSRRVYRSVRRPVIIWNQSFGFNCSSFGDLTLNGRMIHNFRYSFECGQALSDIRVYGDFCDGEDLYDQTGMLEAQFSYDFQCREALGYFY